MIIDILYSVFHDCTTQRHLKIKILVQCQGESEIYPADILKYVEDLK